MSITKLNKGKKFSFQYNKDNVKFFKLSEFVNTFGLGRVFTCRSAHIKRDGKYGDSSTLIVTDDNGNVFGVNCPAHMNDVIDTIINTTEYIDDFDNQRAGVKAYEYTDRDGNKRYSLEFVDLTNK